MSGNTTGSNVVTVTTLASADTVAPSAPTGSRLRLASTGYPRLMSNPQQPEVARSRKTPAQDQDAVASAVDGQPTPTTEGRTGPVPPENQPGHRPENEQDKPDLDDFAARLGVTDQPADEVVDRQLEAQAQPLPAVAGTDARPAPKMPALAGALVAVLALLGVVLGMRRRGRRRR